MPKNIFVEALQLIKATTTHIRWSGWECEWWKDIGHRTQDTGHWHGNNGE